MRSKEERRAMERHQSARRTRRDFLWTFFALPVAGGLALGDRHQAIAQAQPQPPTPSCAEKDDATPTQTEGPYYKRNSPQRTSLLEAGITGTKIVVTGAVLSTDCRPIAGVLLDFWQADARGVYDNAGSKLRGHQFTDATGHSTCTSRCKRRISRYSRRNSTFLASLPMPPMGSSTRIY